MIHTSKQLKDKVRNITHGNSEMAQMLIRNFIMERFLERVSMSKYNSNFILKGGMLVAALLGIATRATMDIDTTVKAIPLTEEDAVRIVNEIIEIHVEDEMKFEIAKVTRIMNDFEYPGIRMMLDGKLDRLKQRIKIDISTDDVITPSAIQFEYPLMFEDRKISLLTYTTETLLAEKMQTILARGVSTTRMRDFYYIYEMSNENKITVNPQILIEAFKATCVKRKTIFDTDQIDKIVRDLKADEALPELWETYRSDNFYVGKADWHTVCDKVGSYILKYTNEIQ